MFSNSLHSHIFDWVYYGIGLCPCLPILSPPLLVVAGIFHITKLTQIKRLADGEQILKLNTENYGDQRKDKMG